MASSRLGVCLTGRSTVVFAKTYFKGSEQNTAKRFLQTLSAKLVAEFGRGFSDKSLRHMVRFAEVFPDEEIVSALRRQLSWTHFKLIIYLDDPLKRDFYAEMCRIVRWSRRCVRL